MSHYGLPPWLSRKESACNVGDTGDMGSIPGLGRSRGFPGEGNGNPFQYSFWDYPMDRGTQQATIHRVPKSQTRLSTHTLEDETYR